MSVIDDGWCEICSKGFHFYPAVPNKREFLFNKRVAKSRILHAGVGGQGGKDPLWP